MKQKKKYSSETSYNITVSKTIKAGENFPAKPDKNPDPTRPHPKIKEPEKNDPTPPIEEPSPIKAKKSKKLK